MSCPVLPEVLERADGSKVVAAEALAGKTVMLFFSAEWCPACSTFVPILHTLYDDAKEKGQMLEVIYVSSDNDAAQKDRYMREKHGDWLSVPFGDTEARDTLKKKYGCFAGKEAPKLPGVKRRSGIPSIVIINQAGEELVHMDVDPPTEITRKGDAILDEWAAHCWS